MKITVEISPQEIHEFPKYVNIPKLKERIEDFFELLLRRADLKIYDHDEDKKEG